jgi:nucleoside-triphosphatase THEP1
MEKKKVIINGSGGVGKDTFVDFCRIYANIMNISSVDKIKESAKILGWDGGKTEADRKFLSDLKVLSTGYNNYPYEYIKANMEQFNNDRSLGVMFIHVREPEEIEKLKKEFNCITLLIQNINKEGISSNMADANVDNYEYDFVVHNDDDLISLKNKAIEFIKSIV